MQSYITLCYFPLLIRAQCDGFSRDSDGVRLLHVYVPVSVSEGPTLSGV